MIIRIPAYNIAGVCQTCWREATPHNDSGIVDVPYLRVRYCEEYDQVGDRIPGPMQLGDRFVVDGARFVVTRATVESDAVPENDGAAGHYWVWVIDALPQEPA